MLQKITDVANHDDSWNKSLTTIYDLFLTVDGQKVLKALTSLPIQNLSEIELNSIVKFLNSKCQYEYAFVKNELLDENQLQKVFKITNDEAHLLESLNKIK